MSKAAELAALIGSQTAQGNKNIIINGAMNVAQRGTVASVTNGMYGGPDRYAITENNDLVVTLSQDTDVPTGSGFLNSMKVDVTTADSSTAAGEYGFLGQKFEGQNLQRLKKGTSSAESVTLSFWVKSTITGTYIIQLYDSDNTRHICKSYTVSSSNTWEFKTLTFAGDTTGAFDDDNAHSLQVYWWLVAGSDYTSGTLATSWASFTAANAAVGQVNAVNSTDNNFYLTGVQLEIGDVATAFEHEDIGTTLAKCQRYYTIEKAGTGGVYKRLALGQCQDSTSAGFILSLSTPLRGTPTLETSGNSNHYQTYSAGAVDTLTGILLTSDSDAGTYNHNIAFNVTVSSGLVAGDGTELVTNNNASYYLAFDAEL